MAKLPKRRLADQLLAVMDSLAEDIRELRQDISKLRQDVSLLQAALKELDEEEAEVTEEGRHLVTLQAAADCYGLATGTIIRWGRKPGIPVTVYQVGGKRMVDLIELETFLASNPLPKD